MFDPYSEENWWLCYAVGGHLAGMLWVPLSPYTIFTLQMSNYWHSDQFSTNRYNGTQLYAHVL